MNWDEALMVSVIWSSVNLVADDDGRWKPCLFGKGAPRVGTDG